MDEQLGGDLMPRLDSPSGDFVSKAVTFARMSATTVSLNSNGGGGGANSLDAPPLPNIFKRLAFDIHLFKGRLNEIELIKKKIWQIREGTILKPLVEIVAPLALGKTWLMQFIRVTFANTSTSINSEAPPTLTTYLDCYDLKQWHSSEFLWSHQLLRELIAQLQAQAGAYTFSFPQVHESEPEFPLSPSERKTTAQEINQWLSELAPNYVPILLFDSLELVPPRFFDWFEQELIEPIVRSRHTLVVTAGRFPRVWRKPETSQRLELWQLSSLENTVWEEQPAANQAWIHSRYAYGHPGMAYPLYLLFQKKGLEKIKELTRNSPQEKAEVGQLLQATVQSVALKGIDPLHRQLIENIATLRLFNTDLLQLFTEKFGGGAQPEQDYSFFRLKISELIDLNLARFSSELNDYIIHPPIRRAVTEAVRVNQGPENFRERHQFALDYYTPRFAYAPAATAEWYIPEILYHRAELTELAQPGSAANATLQELDALLKDPAYGFQSLSLDKLAERFDPEFWRQPKNRDVEELHRDLIQLIGEPAFDALFQRLQAHNQSVGSA